MQPANKHFKEQHCQPGLASLPDTLRIHYNKSRLDNDVLVVQHPAGPSRCPIAECEWASCATDKNVVTSLEKHLYVKHMVEVKGRLWSCRDCGVVESGHEIRFHKKKRCRAETALSLPAVVHMPMAHSTQVDQIVPVLIWPEVTEVQNESSVAATPGRDDFTSFNDSDDCNPPSPVRGGPYTQSPTSSSPVRKGQMRASVQPCSSPIWPISASTEAAGYSPVHCDVRSSDFVSVGATGLVQADLSDAVAVSCQPIRDHVATDSAGLVKADSLRAYSAAGVHAVPEERGSQSSTCVLAGLRQETDGRPADASAFIPAAPSVSPPPSCLSSPEIQESDDFISNTCCPFSTSVGCNNYTDDTDIDDLITGSLRLSAVPGIASVSSEASVHVDLQPETASAPAETAPYALREEGVASFRSDLGCPETLFYDDFYSKSCNQAELAPAPTPDLEARSTGTAGWSPLFLAHPFQRQVRPWISEGGLLPTNVSIWSMSPADCRNMTIEPVIGERQAPDQPIADRAQTTDPCVARQCSPLATDANLSTAQPAVALQFEADRSSCAGSAASDLADFASLTSEAPSEVLGYSEPKKYLFYERWAPAFRSCQSIADLDSTISRCMADWLRRTAKALVQMPAEPDHAPKPKTRRRKRPPRQLQRIKQRENRSADEARKIQTMFKIYPRRAVRRALGDTSPSYSGCATEARAFLSNTYTRPPPSGGECSSARALYDACHWSVPDDEISRQLDRPPTRAEIEYKLAKAANTAPGADGVEYRHLRALDPRGLLLETMYQAVWRVGIPSSWKFSKTVPIYKKGPTDDFGNFRPISLLSTTYKIFSGVLNDRLCDTAINCQWLSHEQKGFLPGVNGVAEHTQLLQSAIEHSKERNRCLVITWLDLRNAFGSIPHGYLQQMFESLPIPGHLRKIMLAIYANNVMSFIVNDEVIEVRPTAGVRQGDALSTTVFNLAAEPIIRAAKSAANSGYDCFGETIKVTAFADDIAVITESAPAMQTALNLIGRVASQLGLEFNAAKCASLLHSKGRNLPARLSMNGQPIKSLSKEDREDYLGIPIGTKLRFNVTTDITAKLDRLAESHLAPWQKIEVLRSHLLPSLSHDLASGRALKADLAKLDMNCRKFMAMVTGVPPTTATAFYYADRSTGGLGMTRLVDDADIWVMARAVQTLSSLDPVLRNIAWRQLEDTIARGFNSEPLTDFPYSAFLSGDRTTSGLYRLRFVGKYANLWTLTRRAALRRRTRIEVSSDKAIRVIADVISAEPRKAVRSLRSVVRNRWTKVFLDSPHQGQVARRLGLVSPKDVARLTSARTTLSHDDYRLVHRVRLDVLPLIGYKWVTEGANGKCRACKLDRENAQHLLNNCPCYLQLSRKRHDSIVALLRDLLSKNGKCQQIAVERALPGLSLRPDVQAMLAGTKFFVDVTVAFDSELKMTSAHISKINKYGSHGKVFPLVVGSLGSWSEHNEDLRSFLGIDARRWAKFRLLARSAAIAGSMDIIRSHLTLTRWEAAGEDLVLAMPRPECDPSVNDEYFTDVPFYDPFEDVISLVGLDDQSEAGDFPPGSDSSVHGDDAVPDDHGQRIGAVPSRQNLPELVKVQ